MKKINVLMVLTSRDHYEGGHPTGLWLEEYAAPYLAFLKAGFAVTLASPAGGSVPLDPVSVPEAMPEEWKAALDALGNVAKLNAVEKQEFDAIVIPGGHGPLFDLASDEIAAKLLMQADANNKVIAAVCHGLAAFVSVIGKDGSPLVAGRRMTGFSNKEEEIAGLEKMVPFALETRLVELGASYEAREPWTEHVVVDGNIITGQNPQSSEKFAQAIVAALKIS